MLEALRRTKRALIAARGSFQLGAIVLSGLLVSAAGCGAGPAPSGVGGNGGSSASSAAGDGGADGGPAKTWTMGMPFSTAVPTYAQVAHPLAIPSFWATQQRPFPTNTEWMNLILGDGKLPVNLLPYVINVFDFGFDIRVPKRSASATAITSSVERDLTFKCGEAIASREITSSDLLSVTMQWNAGGNKSLTAPMVRGMPYATAIYIGITPIIDSSHPIVKVNDSSVPGPVMDNRFTVEFNNNNVKQTWVIYAESTITFNWTAAGLVSTGPYNGALRAALVGPAVDALAVLDKHKVAYPVGGEVTAEVTGDASTIGFKWKKKGDGPLLMMALPHHLDTLDRPEKTSLSLPSIKGDMVAVTGDNWTLNEPLVKLSWSAPSSIVADKVTDIKTALARDAVDEQANAEDVYTFGKQIAKLARLVLIADELKDDATSSAVREKMKTALEPWLQGKNKDAFKYDNTWGGICTTDGLAASSGDFGQGWYNAHHFQYGYFLYAAAAITKSDKPWFTSHKEAIVSLARDIANPSTADLGFTRFRHKDWFTGHSWASGLFESQDSRNQDSSSEAVNAWYGLYLLGLAAGEQELTNVGRVLLATEIRSTHKYWHIKQGSPIYGSTVEEQAFAGKKIVGTLWSTKVEYNTVRFGGAPEIIHGTQMLPFTPMTEALLDRDWVTEQYPVFAAAQPADEGSKGFVYMDHAILDPQAAWLEVNTLQGYDKGNSKTNTLYWVATRPAK
jgi:endo-1,3(4)-beta-glucanase